MPSRAPQLDDPQRLARGVETTDGVLRDPLYMCALLDANLWDGRA
jgi:hypothetical protein